MTYIDPNHFKSLKVICSNEEEKEKSIEYFKR